MCGFCHFYSLVVYWFLTLNRRILATTVICAIMCVTVNLLTLVVPFDLYSCGWEVNSIFSYRIHHPFLLSDNRHYTFYVWRRVYMFHPLMPYLLVPIYLACAWAWFLRIGTYPHLTRTCANMLIWVYRRGPNAAADATITCMCSADAATGTTARAKVLLGAVYIAPRAGVRRWGVGGIIRGRVVCAGERGDDERVFVRAAGGCGSLHVVGLIEHRKKVVGSVLRTRLFMLHFTLTNPKLKPKLNGHRRRTLERWAPAYKQQATPDRSPPVLKPFFVFFQRFLKA